MGADYERAWWQVVAMQIVCVTSFHGCAKILRREIPLWRGESKVTGLLSSKLGRAAVWPLGRDRLRMRK